MKDTVIKGVIHDACMQLGHTDLHECIDLQWSKRATRRIGQAKYDPFAPTFPYILTLSCKPWAVMSDDERLETIRHEVAHIACYDAKDWKEGHGNKWRAHMRTLGYAEPRRTMASENLAGVHKRKVWPARCACRTFLLSTVRRNKQMRGKATYKCRKCHTKLELVGTCHMV